MSGVSGNKVLGAGYRLSDTMPNLSKIMECTELGEGADLSI